MKHYNPEMFIKDIRTNVLLSSDKQVYRHGDVIGEHIVKGYFAVHGVYCLNREVNGEIYQRDVEVIIEAFKDMPRLFLPSMMSMAGLMGFDHFYKDEHCCLGTSYEVMSRWEGIEDAESFFSELIDPYLVNMYSACRSGRCAVGELPHGLPGVEEDYAEKMGITAAECHKILPKVHGCMKKNNKLMMPCPCGSGLKVRFCRCGVSEFIKRTISDDVLLDAAKKDMGVLNVSRKKHTRKN